jgi:dephospho-CoA kinase
MLLVGLTGGIGSGKSTVAGRLARHGAVVLDTDALAREAVTRGTPGHERVVEEFGPEILRDDGEIDRSALADRVFASPAARARLEDIVHPIVRARLAEEIEAYRGTDRIVVVDSPLIVESGQHGSFDVLVVVSAPEEEQIARITEARTMTEPQVRARIRAQMPLEEKARVADVVLDNDGTLEELHDHVDRLWTELRERTAR